MLNSSLPHSPARRSLALDALRGLAILGMGLSGRLPWGSLPAWMYHAQTPPPDMNFNQGVFGLTWVDLVFPFFLFALGAAIPFSLGKRIETQQNVGQTLFEVLKRGVLLALFAVVAQHFRPETMQPWEGINTSKLAIGLFFAMLLAWGSWPMGWPRALRYGLTGLGVVACAWFGYALRFVGEPVFWSWNRSDIILMVLANVAVSGSLIWWATRESKKMRATIIAVLAAIFLVHEMPGPFHQVWAWSPFPAFYQAEFHKYLLIVLPGTLAGDWLRQWHRGTDIAAKPSRLDRSMLFLVAVTMCLSACYGLLAREIEWTWQALGVLSAIGALALMSIPAPLRKVGMMGIILLLIGMILEPIGGGIRKDSATISYFFLTGGLACWGLIGLWAVEPKDEVTSVFLRIVNSPMRYLASAGANPMIAYVGITNLVPGIVRETGFHGWVGGQPWDPWGFAGYALAQTIAVGLVAGILTRFKIYMRA